MALLGTPCKVSVSAGLEDLRHPNEVVRALLFRFNERVLFLIRGAAASLCKELRRTLFHSWSLRYLGVLRVNPSLPAISFHTLSI